MTEGNYSSLYASYPGWADEVETAQLRLEIEWEEKEATVMGRRVSLPRRTAFYGEDTGITYRYSGTLNTSRVWSPTLRLLVDRLGDEFGLFFNCCLINLYRDGHDYMGWHADDEREGAPGTAIASVSFGAKRRFGLRPKRAKNNENAEFLELGHGDLLIMKPGCQEVLKHGVPKALRVTEERINLTFREFLRK